MTCAIIDYGSGNLRSAAKAFERMAAESGRGGPIVVTSDPEVAAKADRVLLPGVGAYRDCAEGIQAIDGMWEALDAFAASGKPFLGICVGMQLMASWGREFYDTQGFGWIPGEVVKLAPADPTLKIPHMGWNRLHGIADHPVFKGIGGEQTGDHAYFVHSYHFVPENPAHRLGFVTYGQEVTAAVGRDNIIGTQFHPEKSQAVGLHLIANFLGWAP